MLSLTHIEIGSLAEPRARVAPRKPQHSHYFRFPAVMGYGHKNSHSRHFMWMEKIQTQVSVLVQQASLPTEPDLQSPKLWFLYSYLMTLLKIIFSQLIQRLYRNLKGRIYYIDYVWTSDIIRANASLIISDVKRAWKQKIRKHIRIKLIVTIDNLFHVCFPHRLR